MADMEKEEDGKKPYILAVDDTTLMLKNITSALSDEYKVFTLSDPMMVEKFLKQMTPDLILLDYKMPYINGFELIPIIRKNEACKNTPIIFLTSMATREHISDSMALGACDYLTKPFQPEVLREKVAKHINKK